MSGSTRRVGRWSLASRVTGWTVLVALGALFLVGWTAKLWRERGLRIETFSTEVSRVPIVAVKGWGSPPGAPVAFLVHGYQCNKSMMLQLAKSLAASGIDSYAIDLPGHGASPEPYSDERAAPAAREALEYLERQEGLAKRRVVLVGHSYGATVLGRIADVHHVAAVFLGPAAARASPGVPRNLLVLTAEHDYEFIIRSAREILAGSTRGAVAEPGQRSGSFRSRDARTWRVVEGVGHVGLILSPRAHREVLGWIELATGHRAPARVAAAALEPAALVLLGPLAIWLLALLGGAPARAAPTGPVHRPALVLTCAWFLALAGARRYVIPLGFLHLREGEILASIVLVAGVLAVALDVLLCRGAHLPPLGAALRSLPAALAGVAVLHLWGLVFVQPDFYHLAISPSRAAAVGMLGVALFPFFAFFDGAFARRGLGTLLAVCLAYGIAALSLQVLGARLERFGPALFALGALCAVVGDAVGRLARNPAAAPAFSALTSAWLIGVGFMRY